jgi:DNA-binding MarR family transcriptional regulator
VRIRSAQGQAAAGNPYLLRLQSRHSISADRSCMERRSMTNDTKVADPSQAMNWGLFEDSVGPAALLLSNALSARSLGALASFGLPPGSLSVLTLIQANSGCSQTDLARTTGMSKSGVVGLVDELERRGLASRDRSPDDRRRNILTLTKKGKAQLEQMADVQIAQENPILERLGKAELRTLIKLLRQAHTAIVDDAENQVA